MVSPELHMRCPDCGANMQGEGICPACGHLVIEDAGEPEAARKKDQADAPALASAEGTDGRLARSRDYTALLLGVAIYDCLLLPLLAARVLFVGSRFPLSVLASAAVCLPLSYIITRLMCTINPETGRWVINNSLLRRIFTKLNAIWIDF